MGNRAWFSAAVALPVAVLLAVAPAASAVTPTAQGAPRAIPTSQPGDGQHHVEGVGPARPGVPAAQVAHEYAQAHARELGVTGTLEPAGTAPKLARGAVVRLQQAVSGIPVLGGQVTVWVDGAGRARSAISETAQGTPNTTAATIDAAAATELARGSLAKSGMRLADLHATPATQWLYDPGLLGPAPTSAPRLAWRTEITSATDPHLRQLVLVDAARPMVLLSFNQTPDALDRIVCDRANSPSSSYACTPATAVKTEAAGGSTQADVLAAFEFAGDTYSFFSGHFGRDSIDGAGMQLVSTVRYCPSAAECPYENAFWDGAQMVYGDGFAAADDVVGHELTHGITQYGSNLFYYMQSGAINESLSDIFGEFIDQANGKGTDTPAVKWDLGEDLTGIGAIRDMADPTLFNDPDRTGSTRYYGGTDDGGGVHTNSGVGNKLAYLITDGGSFNGQVVTGLGLSKAAAIIYGASLRLTSAADYRQFAVALRQSCSSLVGTGGITAGDCASVENAIVATEMDVTPAKAAVPTTPDACPTGQDVTATVFADDLENDASGNWTKSHASSLQSNWYYASEPNPYDASVQYATSGTNNLWGDDDGVVSDHRIAMAQPLTVPAGARLRFSHAFGFESDSAGYYDGGVLEYRVSGGAWMDAGALILANGYLPGATVKTGFSNPLAGRTGFLGTSHGYQTTIVDLATLAGQSVAFRFRIGTDRYYGDYGWFIDDVSIYQCAGTPPAPAAQSIDFAQPPATALTVGSVAISVAASSGLPVTVTSQTPGVCTASATSATLLAAGTCTLTATQAGNASYAPAPPVSRSFEVTAPPAPPAQTPTSEPQAAQPQATQTQATQSSLKASAAAVSHARKLRVQVIGSCSTQYRFQLQKRSGSGWKLLKTKYRTRTASHTRTIDKGKGVYRAVVAAACGSGGVTTQEVTLRR